MQFKVPANCEQILFILGDAESSKFGDAFLLHHIKERRWKVIEYDRIELGKNGWTRKKSEGDLSSPIGQYQLLFCFGKAEYQTACNFPFLINRAGLVAVDDPNSQYYNRILDQDYISNPDWNSVEQMCREDHLYDLGLVADINYLNPEPGKGSCLFHHVKRGLNGGTEGCIAYSFPNWIRIMSQLHPKFAPILIQGPREDLNEFLNTIELEF